MQPLQTVCGDAAGSSDGTCEEGVFASCFKHCSVLRWVIDIICYLLPSLVQERQCLQYFVAQIPNNPNTNETMAHTGKVGLNFNTVRNGTCTTQTHNA